MGIALPECFHSTTVATSGAVIPPRSTRQHQSDFKATQPAHTRSEDDENDGEDEEDEDDEDDEEDDEECQDDEEDEDKIQATASIHGPTATHEIASQQPTVSHDHSSQQPTAS